MQKISDTIERKFVESFDISDWEIETDSGWHDITQLHKTIEYQEWVIETESGESLVCADTHIMFNENYDEVFAKDLIENKSYIITKTGPKLVSKVVQTEQYSNMFDITVDSCDHRFYSNDILSHNTTTSVGYLLWLSLFSERYSIAITANKKALAVDILSRYQLAYENLPMWLQQGVVIWNKGSVELENGAKLLAASTAASSIRGGSFNCVVKDTKITILDDYGSIFYINIQDANSPKYTYDENYKIWEEEYLYYTIYKITNNINNKEYIGYHQTNNLNDSYMGSGKLIKRAIEKYGIENFTKKYIEIFKNRADAEALEAELVNEEYTLRTDTYNLCLGGNVRIMVGENNGFFEKTHSDDTLKYLSEINIGRNISVDDDIIINNIRYNSFADAKIKLNLSTRTLIDLILLPNNGYVDIIRQEKLQEKINDIELRKLENNIASAIACKERFTGVSFSEERRKNLSISRTGIPKTEEHVNKINKNPEKIRKTAEAHTGMKRKAETKEKMSLAKKGKDPHNKGKIYCYDPKTLKTLLCFEYEMPEGWCRGVLSRRKIV